MLHRQAQRLATAASIVLLIVALGVAWLFVH